MKAKKIKILVPTDFSVCASNAFNWAAYFADSLNAELHLVHVEFLGVPISDLPIFPQMINTTQDAQIALDNVVRKHKNTQENGMAIQSQIHIETIVRMGSAEDEIVEMSPDYDYIVMGMTGLQDFVDTVIGSVSTGVANNAKCPVILVPRDYVYTPIRTLMYAFDAQVNEKNVMKKVIHFTDIFDARIHFVHVNTEVDIFDLNHSVFSKLLDNDTINFAYQIDSLYGDDVIEKLKNYLEKGKFDLAIFQHKHRNIWQRLFHKSISHAVAVSASTPVMILK